jgi:type III restriction enzyme
MRLQFDPNQQFQLDAVNAVVDLFDGQERGAHEFSVVLIGEMTFNGTMCTAEVGPRQELG